MNAKAADPFIDQTKCAMCGLPLPMAGGSPMPTACLKCFPNGPVKQGAKDEEQQKQNDGDSDDDDDSQDDGEE